MKTIFYSIIATFIICTGLAYADTINIENYYAGEMLGAPKVSYIPQASSTRITVSDLGYIQNLITASSTTYEQNLASYFTATSTTATSTFPNIDVTNLSLNFTAGSIPFSNGSHLIENNANLFWNDGTNTLQVTNIDLTTGIISGVPSIDFDIINRKYLTDNYATIADDLYLLNIGDTASGDYNFSSDTLFIDDSESRIGIGTSSPYAKLSVVGNIVMESFYATSTTQASVIDYRLGIGTNAPATLLDVNGVITATGGISTEWNLGYDHSINNNQAHTDYLKNTGDTATGDYDFNSMLFIDDANNKVLVGANSTLAGAIFQVIGTNASVFMNDTGNAAYWGFGSAGGAFQIYSATESGGFLNKYITMRQGQKTLFYNESLADMNFVINDDSGVLAHFDGGLRRVGIGTSSPFAKLSVEGVGNTINTIAFAVSNSDDTTMFTITDDGTVIIGTSTSATVFDNSGLQTMTGTARVMKSQDLEPVLATRPVSNPPGEGTEDSFTTHDFAGASTDESVYFHLELSHDYASEGTVHIHFDFFVDTAPDSAQSVVWGIEYKKQSIGDNFDFGSGTATLYTQTAITTVTPDNDKKVHQSDEINLVTTGFVAGDYILIRLFRNASETSGLTDNFPNDARVIDYHIEYLSDKLGEGT